MCGNVKNLPKGDTRKKVKMMNFVSALISRFNQCLITFCFEL